MIGSNLSRPGVALKLTGSMVLALLKHEQGHRADAAKELDLFSK